VRDDGSALTLAYHLPGCLDSAVVRFSEVAGWYYGSPSDERLSAHPLWGHGLEFYQFHFAEFGGRSCWIGTFHDGTFEILAAEVSVLSECLEGISPGDALRSMLGPGPHLCLDAQPWPNPSLERP
jgi:hypothetical protein